MARCYCLLLSVCLFVWVSSTRATEWQHRDPSFEPYGQVTIRSPAGNISQLSNRSQLGLQSSASPTILNVTVGGKTAPAFAVGGGTKVWAFFPSAGFVEYTAKEFSDVYTYNIDSGMKQSSVVASLTVSGKAAPGMTNSCSPAQVNGSHPQGYSLVSTGQSPCAMTFKVGDLNYISTHSISCSTYTCSISSRGDIMLRGRSIAVSMGNTQYTGSAEDLYGYDLSQDLYHEVRYTYFDRSPDFYSATTTVRANASTQTIFFVKHNGDVYWRAAQNSVANALYYDIHPTP